MFLLDTYNSSHEKKEFWQWNLDFETFFFFFCFQSRIMDQIDLAFNIDEKSMVNY